MPPANASASPRLIKVRAVPIELAQLIKFAGLIGSGGEVKTAIKDGEVLLNGVVETRRGKKLVAGDKVTAAGQTVIVEVG